MKHELQGKIIGIFDIIADSGKRNPSGNIIWDVKCKLCGAIKQLPYHSIKIYKSCGCKTGDLLSASLRKSLNRGGYGDIYATHWTSIRKNAKQRTLDFEITVEDAWEMFLKQDRKCVLTGVSLQFPTRCWSKDGTASLDRIDSTKGYVAGNVQWVHKRINMMKQQYSHTEFFEWCKQVVIHNNLLS